jgi:outer membrane protein assembly factor BamB
MLLVVRTATFLRAIACGIVVLASGGISAKRFAPEPVKPVTVAGVTYVAPGWPIGIIIANDASSNRELWRKRIYTLHYDRRLEQDVQDVFITSLEVRDGNALIITNERGERYILDLSTRKVIRGI